MSALFGILLIVALLALLYHLRTSRQTVVKLKTMAQRREDKLRSREVDAWSLADPHDTIVRAVDRRRFEHDDAMSYTEHTASRKIR